jgi:hypothetical protein
MAAAGAQPNLSTCCLSEPVSPQPLTVCCSAGRALPQMPGGHCWRWFYRVIARVR